MKHDFDLFDNAGYPTDEALKMIENWDVFAHKQEFIDYLESLWSQDFNYNGAGYQDKLLRLSTGGWSGNEDIIQAMRKNTMFWLFAWEQSRRGGHYIFDMSRIKDENCSSAWA